MRNCLCLVLAGCAFAAMAHAEPPLTEMTIGNERLNVEVAVDAAARQLGLMYRKELPEDRGMLFRFADAGVHCMWMKNTYIPLTAAFLDEEGRIVDLIDLEPESTETRCSSAPARYAIEVNQGWFEKHGIEKGARVEGLR
ncbi:DUF192 domain-containing protein [Pseudomonas matsuisoli]|uniref:DUF192 domain-containing protein n=1 Tax=Pseudomonas matsuisoli TaxID=1515666 RepID=A0A917PPG2_9PSED|nr:DUF192 domain-containing protein [Pseudomonas matsuisoli]GGJ85947.1 hypothetical protein GCM10009304_10040 [Pseudomonas matsuisoli]